MARGQPIMAHPPPEVLEQLRACRPTQVQERAWLVIYYSVVLAMVSSKYPEDEDTKSKLRCNLYAEPIYRYLDGECR
jgi:hypothetical protein